MASQAKILSDMILEAGKETPDIRKKISLAIDEATIDLLSNNDGRFEVLSLSVDLTFNVGDSKQKLPVDFKTAHRTLVMLDANGKYIGEREIITEREYFRRKSDAAYDGTIFFYIRFEAEADDGRGWYLYLSSDAGEVLYFRFFYYRNPQPNDCDLIQNEMLIKHYIRGKYEAMFPMGENEMELYLLKKGTYIDSPDTRSGTVQIKPPRHIADHNRMMKRIGRNG